MKKLRILSIGAPHNASGWFRIRQYFNEFERRSLAVTHMIDGSENETLRDQLFESADIIVCQYNTRPEIVMYAKGVNKSAKLVVDFDDNCFSVPPSSPAYKQWGTEDVIVKTNDGEKELWISGKTEGFNKFRNKKVLEGATELAKMADVVTCASLPLTEYMGKYSKRTAYVPNTIDPQLVYDYTPPDDSQFKIMWHGTGIHQLELSSVLGVLQDFMRDNKDAHYYQLGFKTIDRIDKKLKRRFHNISWVQFQAVLPVLQLNRFNVGIIPLRENAFNYYKAESKWLEMAAAGIPVIVQAPSPYADVVKHGITGIKYSDSDNLLEQLRWAKDNPEEMSKIAINAREWVLENRNLVDWSDKLLKFYKEL